MKLDFFLILVHPIQYFEAEEVACESVGASTAHWNATEISFHFTTRDEQLSLEYYR